MRAVRCSRAAILAVSLVLGGLVAACATSDEAPATLVPVAVIAVESPPEDGSGPTPRFAWSGVDGAATYAVVVRDPGGRAAWAWEGPATDIWFGGLSQERPPGMPGPTVADGSTWRVVAFDADGGVIGVSAERRLGD